MRIPQETRHAARISVASIVLAGIVLLILRRMYQVSHFGALELSVLLGVAVWLTLFVRRYGQAHMALGVYLLVIGGAMLILPWLLLNHYGQNDPDILFFFLGPIYSVVGSVLILLSMISHRHWMESVKTMLVRTLLLAGPAALLILLCPVAFSHSASGPQMWDNPPYGFDLAAPSWVLGIGIFFAGSRFVKTVQPDAHHETFSGSTQ